MLVFAAVFGVAESSLPGDLLYGVKRFTEDARTTLMGQQFSARRLDEIRALEVLKRPEAVEFEGTVTQIEGVQWRIAGLDVQVVSGIARADAVIVGDLVHVSAYTTSQGELIASALTPLEKISKPPVSTPVVTPSIDADPRAYVNPNANRHTVADWMYVGHACRLGELHCPVRRYGRCVGCTNRCIGR